MKKIIHYIIIGLIIFGAGLGLVFILIWALGTLNDTDFSETFNGGTIEGFIDKETHKSFQGNRLGKEEYASLGELEGYDGGDIYIGDEILSKLLEGENDWIDSEGYYHQREKTDAQVYYHSKGLYNEKFELLSGAKIEKDDSLGVWVYSKGIYKDGKFETTETHHYIIDEDCSKDGLEPICFQGAYDGADYNRERIAERCFVGHSCGLGSHILEYLYSYEKLD